MSLLDRFAAYAAAFEDYFASGDVGKIEPFFTEDAVYETLGGPPFEGLQEGRDAVLAYLKTSVDGFDRQFATRTLEVIEGPQERESGVVWMRWKATYSTPDLPDLSIDGEEAATFRGDRIARLEDRFSPEAVAAATKYLAEHGARLAQD